ncbi:MAG TPA: ABC transporter permease subunit [Polyangiaceae bacterium]|nr:ABC transporter permease subunit [Polyangiaceae bacterium]
MSTAGDFALGLARTFGSSLGAMAIAVLVAFPFGTLAARRGGIYDDLLRRSLEFAGALPVLVAIPLLGRFWPMTLTCAVVLGVHQGLCVACLFRNELERGAREGFVMAARSLGLGAQRTHRRHVLPFALPLVLIGALLVVPKVVGVEAALRYVGLDKGASIGGFLVAPGGALGAFAAGLALATWLLLHHWTERLVGRILHGDAQIRAEQSCEAPGTD